MDLSPNDRDLMIRTVIGEANGDPSASGVAHVIMNRLASGKYGQSVGSVVLAPSQFEPWSTRAQELMSYAPTSKPYQAAAQVVDGVTSGQIPDPTNGATNFYSPTTQAALGRRPPKWDDGTGQPIGKHVFFGGGVNSDFLSDYEIAPPKAGASSAKGKSTPAPVPAAPSGEDFLHDFEVAPAAGQQASPSAVASGGIVRQVPRDATPGQYGLMWNADGGYDPKTGELVIGGNPPSDPNTGALPVARSAVSGFISGMPIIGAPLQSAVERGSAQARSYLYGDDPTNALAKIQDRNAADIAAHPVANVLGQIGGGIVATAPAMAAAPELFGFGKAPLLTNMAAGAGTGAAINGADAFVRSGADLDAAKTGAFTGAALGAGAPVLGAAAGGIVNKASNLLANTTPSARLMAEILDSIGMSAGDAKSALAKMGPEAVAADLDPALTDHAVGLASVPGAPSSILGKAMASRAATADDRMAQIVNETLGPKPDAQKIVSDIQARAGANSVDGKVARSAITDAMGEAKDPYAELQGMVKARSTAAEPLYEKAMRGGSIAPLEKQFQSAFADAAETSSQASKDLAAAQQKQLLARAAVSNAGENVYASNAALAASRDADAAVADAQKAVSSAEANKQDILQRLRQAQSDGSTNAPGAVWSPRIQQFLDDPIMQPALAKGVRIQRLESLAKGKSFDPTEFAITGTDELGNPSVAKVPNMRTLNVAKKGLDAMVEEAKDPVTGRLSEEGRAIDNVRSQFLNELDKVNPDYAAARQSWAGPSQAHEAFNKGLSIFQNRSGPTGVNSTPGALADWFSKASDGEKEAAKIGARSAFEQQMSAASDPASKAAALANKEVNQQKLATILGKDEADKLVGRLSFKYEDPVGQAFEKGMSVFKQREGVPGVGDTPDALKAWMKTASPSEIEAHQQGARQAIEQALTAARQGDVSAARSLFAKSTANREKLDAIFPGAQKMFDALYSQLRQRTTENLIQNSTKTANKQAIQRIYAPPQESALSAAPAIIGNAVAGGYGAAGATAANALWRNAHSAITEAGRQKLLAGMARGLSATGPEQASFLDQVRRAALTNGATNALSQGANAMSNIATRNANALLPSYLSPGR